MADPLDIVEEQATRDQRDRLGQAAHDASWLSTFSGPQSTAALRAKRDVSQLTQDVLDRKMALAAQTDEHAMQIYATGKHLEEFEKQAPLREQLLTAQISAQGASTRYKAAQDAATAGQVTSFYNGLANIDDPVGTPEHAAAVLKLAADHPLAASTKEVSGILKDQGRVHDTAATLRKSLQDYREATGMEPTSVETTATGGVNLRNTDTSRATKPNPVYLKQVQAVAEAQAKKDAAYNANKSADLTLHDNRIAVEQAKLDAVKEALGIADATGAAETASTTAKPAASIPKHLGTYNPKTGNFE